MMIFAAFFAIAGFCLALVLRPLAGGAWAGDGAPASFRELVAEHLRLSRGRLDAAEARLALLEERLDFHEGFRNPPRAVRRSPEGVIPLHPRHSLLSPEDVPNPVR